MSKTTKNLNAKIEKKETLLNHVNFKKLQQLGIGKYKYKELCEVHKVFNKYATGNTKIAQITELGFCCEFKQKGIWIVITNIFDNPMTMGNVNISLSYREEIEALIFNELSKHGDENGHIFRICESIT